MIDLDKLYAVAEAVELIGKTSFVKFDAAVELHINLGVDPKQADQAVRGTVSLPHGSGKSQRVAALVPEAQAKAAKEAGADVVGEKELLADIEKGKLDFDILVTTPDLMPTLAKHAKILGPKGLMPSPKSGTVTATAAKTIKELKGGRVEFRLDSAGLMHQVVGRVSYKPAALAENISTLLKALQQAKPSGIKGTYIQKVTLASTMGPGIKLDITKAIN